MFDLEHVFGPAGVLAQRISVYRPRQGQLEMAQAVKKAIHMRACLIAEAGTGTGKTFAYLVPAIASRRRIIISTGTKNLQDQLFHKDLPIVREALGLPFHAALLKGRNNYLCLYRLENALTFKAGQGHLEAVAIERIKRWARTTPAGDTSEVTEIPESSPLWQVVTSTIDNCLGQECPNAADCFLIKARRKAQDAEILVINHHLLWADWALKNDGFGELLPETDAIVVDEAHQFAETAAQFLGLSLSSRQISELANDIVIEQLKDARDQAELAEGAEKLEVVITDLRLAFGIEPRREAWATAEHCAAVNEKLALLRQQLRTLAEQLKPAAVRGKGLESCWKRCEELEARLKSFLDDVEVEGVRWFETHKRNFTLNRTPLEIAEEFDKFRQWRRTSWIFTSATLSVAGHFEHFASALGLGEAETRSWESPFDYRQQCLFYLPTDLPEPASRDYTASVVRAALPVLRASQGRAFLLFTSRQAMLEAATLLPAELDYPLFVQGTQPKTALLDRFKLAGNGILLGTASFWEGVDVRGPALSCVIIDKLPFASPSDPVLSARLEALKRSGKSPFGAYQLPAAVIALKQGVGRLIRSSDDRGVLMLCDPRLVSRPYGKVFLKSLPPMRRTRRLSKVEEFFRAEPA